VTYPYNLEVMGKELNKVMKVVPNGTN